MFPTFLQISRHSPLPISSEILPVIIWYPCNRLLARISPILPFCPFRHRPPGRPLSPCTCGHKKRAQGLRKSTSVREEGRGGNFTLLRLGLPSLWLPFVFFSFSTKSFRYNSVLIHALIFSPLYISGVYTVCLLVETYLFSQDRIIRTHSSTTLPVRTHVRIYTWW